MLPKKCLYNYNAENIWKYRISIINKSWLPIQCKLVSYFLHKDKQSCCLMVTYAKSKCMFHFSIAQLIKTSGGRVPEYMLKMKKLGRNKKVKQSKKPVEREPISVESREDKKKYQIMKE